MKMTDDELVARYQEVEWRIAACYKARRSVSKADLLLSYQLRDQIRIQGGHELLRRAEKLTHEKEPNRG